MNEKQTQLRTNIIMLIVMLSLTTNAGLSAQDYLSPSAMVADNQAGKIYIGTELGISVYESPLLVNTENNLETLRVGPNPYRLGTGRVMITGISNNSGLKILSQTGTLIKYFSPAEIMSGVVYWDGRNRFNEVVASGVYVLVASNEEGNVQTAKILTFR